MPAGTRIARMPQWTHYQQAVVDIELPEGTVRVAPAPRGVTVGSFPAPDGETIHVVTAHNPRGRLASRPDNDRAHREMLGLLRRRELRWWPAVGGDADSRHTEVSAAIVGLSDHQARALGRQFGQDAVFAWSTTTWRLLSCSGPEEVLTRGWQSSRTG
ncbi:DUF3293 domain-containing protein [Streptomyces sp. NPDC020298]|uniref:DUF3293 domain-containing protein n=1 Tax=unclassified Streptomyces TaxID=2593676 RepID=UPI0033DC98DD